jgi:hypothetical protein
MVQNTDKKYLWLILVCNLWYIYIYIYIIRYATIQTILYTMYILYIIYAHHSSHTTIDHKFLICISNFNMYFKPRIFKNLVFASVHLFTNFCNISIYPSFVIHPSEHGHMGRRNVSEVHNVYNIDWHTYVHLLVSPAISNCSLDRLKLHWILCDRVLQRRLF